MDRKIITGFAGRPQNDNKENIEDISKGTTTSEIDTLNDVNIKLSRETISFQDFESRLRKELLNVQDLQRNLTIIKDQIKSSENMLAVRQNILEKLMAERNKRLNMNIEQCKIYFNTIRNLDEELRNNIEKIMSELKRLILDEKSLFDTNTKNKEIISNISQEAQDLSIKVILLGRHHSSADDILGQIYKEFIMIERERQSRR